MSIDMQQRWADRPLGMRDVYPQQARQRRQLESKLLRVFEQNGFEMVSCGLLEYVDTLLRGRASSEAEDWLRMVDATGRTVVLRPEMTPSIARMAAPLLAAGTTEIRWSYAERVYRRTNDPASLSWASGKAAESTQVGVEWIGRSGAEADADVIALCQAALEALELDGWQMVASHAAFAPAFLEAHGIAPETAESLTLCLARGDYVGFRGVIGALSAATGVADDVLDQLSTLDPLAADLPEPLLRRFADSEAGRRALTAWKELRDLAAVLQRRGLADRVSFDLTLVRDLTYYTGIVFEVFAPGAGAPIALGGRYDDLLVQFGTPAPAIGFAFEAERLLTVQTEGEWLHEADERGASPAGETESSGRIRATASGEEASPW
ncbi:ATP phosphoribosyltransferase regulatory subunit [Alicyclobacillus macrosporangiidus]|uniref:ATP phosphoribosyltransferase regulatory subunit n=1 Tax=Alicyclobacillus macrosporangiidus TaxID=392015 RepID=UPI000AA01374|nr:ATP phosphoribosyltransferase regulatory subunit [Alicyclobacillus macrosporangiidus]